MSLLFLISWPLPPAELRGHHQDSASSWITPAISTHQGMGKEGDGRAGVCVWGVALLDSQERHKFPPRFPLDTRQHSRLKRERAPQGLSYLLKQTCVGDFFFPPALEGGRHMLVVAAVTTPSIESPARLLIAHSPRDLAFCTRQHVRGEEITHTHTRAQTLF